MIKASSTIGYFGKSIVERSIAAYFAKNGLGTETRDKLITMASEREDEFLEMVCQFIDGEPVC